MEKNDKLGFSKILNRPKCSASLADNLLYQEYEQYVFQEESFNRVPMPFATFVQYKQRTKQ